MLKGLIGFLGRLLLSLIFLASGVHKILDWQGTEQAVHVALMDALQASFGMIWLQNLIEMAVPLVPILVAIAVICELLGGLCVLLGVQVRFGAFLLIVFLIPTTLLIHPFWTVHGPGSEMQLTLFMKNASILGGLLLLLAYGKGDKGYSKKSHDAKD